MSARYFHVAPRAARESIALHGLNPARALDRSADPFDAAREARAPGVWLYSDLDDAVNWAGYSETYGGGEQDVYEVRAADLPMVPDPFASTENGYYVRGPIPVNRLRLAAT